MAAILVPVTYLRSRHTTTVASSGSVPPSAYHAPSRHSQLNGSAAGQAMECQSAPEANRKAEAMSRDPANAGALSFMRTGDPSLGNFADATILKKFGDVPENLDEL